MSADNTNIPTGIEHDELNLLSRLNRTPVNKTIIRIVVLLMIVWVIEAFDVGIVASLVLILRDLFNLNASQVGLLGLSAALGVVLGMIPAGRLADRVGRKKVLVWGLVWFSLFTLLGPLFSNFWWIVVMRFIAGLGEGAVFPMPYLMMSEFIKSNRRATAIGWQNGALLASYVFPGLVGAWAISNFAPEVAWRIPFIIGGLPIFYAIVIHKWLPESPRWLISQNRVPEVRSLVEKLEDEAGIPHDNEFIDPGEIRAQRATHIEQRMGTIAALATLLKPPFLSRSLISWGAFSTSVLSFYTILVYFPSFFAERGIAAGNAVLLVGIMSAVSGIGSVAEGYLADRYGRRPLILIYALLSAVGIVLLGYVTSVIGLLVVGFLGAFFGLAANSITKIYIAEQYPTPLRGMGVGTGEAVARLLGSVLAVYYIALILEAFGLRAVLWSVGIAVVVVVAPVLIWGRETKDLSLEELGATESLEELGVVSETDKR